MKWFRVFFKGGDEDRLHEEVFGVKAMNIESAQIEALRQMRDEFHIRYPEIYRIEENGKDEFEG